MKILYNGKSVLPVGRKKIVKCITKNKPSNNEENIYFVLGKSKVGNGRLKPVNKSFVLDKSKLDIDRIY